MGKIFIAEDEENLLSTLRLNLELEGYAVNSETNGKRALYELKQNSFDLVILDVMLPEMDGFTICENLRLLGNNVPVLFLTAKGEAESRIRGLKIGGDDYLVKPFNLEELLLRVGKLINRTPLPLINRNPEKKGVKVIAGCEVDFDNLEVKKQSTLIENFSRRESELLYMLVSHPGEVISRDRILDEIWNEEQLPTSRTIDNFILKYRKIFETNSREPLHFLSIRGVGYKFVP